MNISTSPNLKTSDNKKKKTDTNLQPFKYQARQTYGCIQLTRNFQTLPKPQIILLFMQYFSKSFNSVIEVNLLF